MIIQIFGTRKCPETRKAERFFKDRKIAYQLRDLTEKPPSKGELDVFITYLGAGALIDTDSRLYKDGGWSYREFDPALALLENPGLYKTPIVRGEKNAAVGFNPGAWKSMAENVILRRDT